MKTLYISDLDGTLLRRDEHLSKFTLQTLNTLLAQGLCFSYATARSLSSARIVTQGLQLHCPVVVHNGTFVTDSVTGELLHANYFTQEEAVNILDCVLPLGIDPFVYAVVDETHRVFWQSGRENEGMLRYLQKRTGDKRFQTVNSTQELLQGRSYYVTCIGEKEQLQAVYDAFSADLRFTCLFHQELYRPEYWFEIMPRCATKANAVQKLKEFIGAQEVVAFGDAVNDIPLFKLADRAYAVQNAVPELKKIATDVIASNAQDGVASWLRAHAMPLHS